MKIENYRLSMDRSHCSTGLFELSRPALWLPSLDDIIPARSGIRKTDGDHQNNKIAAVLFFVMPI